MTPHHLLKIKRALQDIRLSPRGRKAVELAALANALGRYRYSRGKEPTYVRVESPALPPPLSIPAHTRDLKVGTVRCIVDVLLDDVEIWRNFLREAGNDDQP